MWISKSKYIELKTIESKYLALDAENKWLREKSELASLLKKHDESIVSCLKFTDAHFGGGTLRLPDDYPQYVDDLFGGRVIRQEANKAICIDKAGNVKTGLTKLPPDIGYCYKLEQEKV